MSKKTKVKEFSVKFHHLLNESFCEERESSAHTHCEQEKKRGTLLSSSSTMYLDSNLKLEVLSSILGEIVKPYDNQRCKTTANILSVDDFHLLNLIGKGQAYVNEFFIDEKKFFDPQYDYDFTDLSDSAECMRGDELYERPKGWYRMALKVKGTYPGGDTWLGTDGMRSDSVPGEWPVSFHGTSLDGAKGIIRSHYIAGSGDKYGRGIYSTPDIHESEAYAKTFTSEMTGKSYKVILQNRINPEKREICQRSDYWLIRVDEGVPTWMEKQIVRNSIRPYGILIKELKDDDESSDDDDKGDDGSDDDSGSIIHSVHSLVFAFENMYK